MNPAAPSTARSTDTSSAPPTTALLIYEDALRFVCFGLAAYAVQRVVSGSAATTWRDKVQMAAVGSLGSAIYHLLIKDRLSVMYKQQRPT
jgi:hypothetical protein